jgi:asparagine synthetase B (glutamine-hydrolysing)
MDEQELEAIDKARDILGEFFGNFAFCVVTEDGELFYDYRDRFVGKGFVCSCCRGYGERLWW